MQRKECREGGGCGTRVRISLVKDSHNQTIYCGSGCKITGSRHGYWEFPGNEQIPRQYSG